MSIEIYILAIISPWKGHGPSFEQTWIPSTQGCFVPSLVEKMLKMWKVYRRTARRQTTGDQKSSLELKTENSMFLTLDMDLVSFTSETWIFSVFIRENMKYSVLLVKLIQYSQESSRFYIMPKMCRLCGRK